MKTFMKTALLFAFIVTLWSCAKDDASPTDKIDVTIKNTESYLYDFKLSGDEEGVVIKTQAKHYSISEIVRNSGTSWNVVYHYTPEDNYVGDDSVEFEVTTGGVGLGGENKKIVKINIKITN